MIKIITWITKIIVIVLTALFFSSCHFDYNSIKGSGRITTENRTITEKFTGIEVSSAIELSIEQSNDTEIVVEADDNLQTSIITEVKNGKLIISSEPHLSIRNGTRKVKVKMPSIEITLGKIYKKKDAYGDYRPIGNPAPKYIVMQSLSKKDGDSITYLCFDLEKGSDVWMLEYVIQKLYELYE